MILIAFEMTHAALAAEAVLTRAGIRAGLAPTPGYVSAGCGFCITIAPEDRERAENTLAADGIEYSGVYERT